MIATGMSKAQGIDIIERSYNSVNQYYIHFYPHQFLKNEMPDSSGKSENLTGNSWVGPMSILLYKIKNMCNFIWHSLEQNSLIFFGTDGAELCNANPQIQK